MIAIRSMPPEITDFAQSICFCRFFHSYFFVILWVCIGDLVRTFISFGYILLFSFSLVNLCKQGAEGYFLSVFILISKMLHVKFFNLSMFILRVFSLYYLYML